MTADQQQPIACTLSGEARQDRRAWIAALVRDALRSSERDDLTLRLRFAPEDVQRIQDMVRKEQACCSFLTFEMEERPQELWQIIRYSKFSHDAGHRIFHPSRRPSRSHKERERDRGHGESSPKNNRRVFCLERIRLVRLVARSEPFAAFDPITKACRTA